MGCTNLPDVVIVSRSYPSNLSKLIKNDIRKLVEKNPFFSLKYQELQIIIKQVKTSNNSDTESTINDNVKNYVNKLISSLRLKKPMTQILEDVLTFASNKFSILLYNQENFEVVVIDILYFFMNENQLQNVERKKELFFNLIIKTTAIENTSNNIKRREGYHIHTGKILMLVVYILKYILFSFVYCFLSIAILNNFTSMNESDLNKLLVEKEEACGIEPSNINDFILQKINLINPHATPENLLSLLLSDIFSPLQQFIQDHIEEEIVYMNNSLIQLITDQLTNYLNIDYILNLFLSGK